MLTLGENWRVWGYIWGIEGPLPKGGGSLAAIFYTQLCNLSNELCIQISTCLQNIITTTVTADNATRIWVHGSQ